MKRDLLASIVVLVLAFGLWLWLREWIAYLGEYPVGATENVIPAARG